MSVLSVSAVLAAIAAVLLGSGNAALPMGSSARYHITNNVIHLKHGKLHLPDDESEVDNEGHLRYKWLEDDIITMENVYDNKDEEEQMKMIQLPGGCELTENQYEELESFKKETRYVEKCYCEQGGVYCQLDRRILRANAS